LLLTILAYLCLGLHVSGAFAQAYPNKPIRFVVPFAPGEGHLPVCSAWVYCRMSEAPGAKGIGAVYIDRGTAGLTFGKPEQLMGFRGIPSADI
jgi:hypothetical protein